MATLTWKKSGVGDGWYANGDHGPYFAERQADGKFLAVLDGCDEYGEPQRLAEVKDRCQALEDDRAERGHPVTAAPTPTPN